MKRIEILVEMSHVLQLYGFFCPLSTVFERESRVDVIQFYIARNTSHSNWAAVSYSKPWWKRELAETCTLRKHSKRALWKRQTLKQAGNWYKKQSVFSPYLTENIIIKPLFKINWIPFLLWVLLFLMSPNDSLHLNFLWHLTCTLSATRRWKYLT